MVERLAAGSDALAITMVAAHPDDEVASLGALLRRLSRRGCRLTLVHVTDGAPKNMADALAAGFPTREAYAQARRLELEAALRAGDVRLERAHVLGAVDQRASYALVNLTAELSDVFSSNPPDVVVTHAYEGGHPDHDATAFIVHAAVARLVAQGVHVEIAEFSSYHKGANGLCAGQFIDGSVTPEHTIGLTSDEVAAKRAMLDCFVTQRRVLEQLPFALSPERVRLAPSYDFTAPPHEGTLFYELFDWGITGSAWRARASAALQDLGLGLDRCV